MPPKTVEAAKWRRHGAAAGNHVAIETAPTLASEGVEIVAGERGATIALDIQHTAAGARSFSIILFGYKPIVLYNGQQVTGTGAWTNIGQIDVASTAVDGGECHQIEGATKFTRLAAQLTSKVGAPTVYCDFGFEPGTRRG